MKQDEQVSRPGFSSWVSVQPLVVYDVNDSSQWWLSLVVSHQLSGELEGSKELLLTCLCQASVAFFLKARNNLFMELLLTVLCQLWTQMNLKKLSSEGSRVNRAYLMWQACQVSSRSAVDGSRGPI